MKAIIRRCTLALIMCGISAAGMAQTVILSENFNLFDYFSSYPETWNGWTLLYCKTLNNTTNSTYSLKFEKNRKDGNVYGYAVTPKLNYTGDAVISFTYAKSESTSGTFDLTVNITDGMFADGATSKSISSSSQKFAKKSFNVKLVSGANIEFQLTSNIYGAIDDVKIVSTDGITLLEANNNGATLTAYNNMTAHVTIRPLAGGIWNTMCLPFDVNMAAMEAALGENQDIKLRTYESYDAAKNVMNFTAVTGSIVIPAGTPFLVWLNTSVESPKFDWVTVKNTAAQSVTDNDVSFVGTYNPVNLSTDGTNLFLTKKNALAIPGAGTNQIKGMRAYISVPESMKFTADNARIAFIDEQPTAIETVESVGLQPVPATYSLSGQRVAQPKKGLYIVNGKLTLIK